MNILFVADVSIAEVIGGAERVIFEQSTHLAERGHDVHILTRRLPGHKQNKDVIQNVKEWRYDVDLKSGALSSLRETGQNSKRLFDFLHNEYNFDCINFYQPFSAFGVIQSSLSKRVKRIYTCFSFSFEEFISRNAKPNGLFKKMSYLCNVQTRKWMEKRVLKSCNEIVVLSQFTQEALLNVYKISPQKVSIIPGGVDLKRFSPTTGKDELRRRLQIPVGKVVLFSVRNLVPRMGLENLMTAMQEVVKFAPDIYLVLGGKGHLKDDLIALSKKLGVEDFIRFVGFIPEEELPVYYRMADLFILPTRELEGFGLVTLEAMASGIPVLGTPVGGTEEILGKFAPNFLFKDIEPDSIAALIVENYSKLKENPQMWKDLSHRCRSFVENNYSWEKNVDSMEEIFSRLLN